uniref:Uncharacterized protein n=1 Tax=Seriola dumerili TaxID=41447 RepID=A0A3B4T368_SERDU
MKELPLLLNFFLEKLSTYAAIIVMFSYSILLDRDFECTCRPNHGDCWLYMVLPVCIIVVLILYTNRSLQRLCRCTVTHYRGSGCCKYHCCSFCGSLIRHILEAVLVGALWAAFVLIDGDWYVCCVNKTFDPQLACKNKNNITAEEQVNIAELKNDSRVNVGKSLMAVVAVPMAEVMYITN